MSHLNSLIDKANTKKPSEPSVGYYGQPKEIKIKSVGNSPQRNNSRLPQISPSKGPMAQPRLKSIYENPEYLSVMKNSVYMKMAEEKA